MRPFLVKRVGSCDTVSILFGKPILEKQIWWCNESTVTAYKRNYLQNKLFVFTPEAVYLWDFRPDVNQWQRDTCPRLRITIKNTTGMTSSCKPTGSSCCQTRNPEPLAGNPLCAVDIASHPWQTRNNTFGEEELGGVEVQDRQCAVTGKTRFLAW